jgi:excinuclease ABC subunit A
MKKAAKAKNESSVSQAAPSNIIDVRGARVHNLKNVDVQVPRGALTVVTGVSGSGKSSLAFDTLYAEGQRRFVESLSAYARQFLDRMNKPDVDSITGLPPAVAIEQQAFSKNPRSTVGTTTEVYDYLRLLYGRIGVVIDKDTGDVVRKDTPQSVADALLALPEGSRHMILAEFAADDDADLVAYRMSELIARGFTRFTVGQGIEVIDVTDGNLPSDDQDVYVVIDRVAIRSDSDSRTRLVDSLESAFTVSSTGRIAVREVPGKGTPTDRWYSRRFEHSRTRTLYIEPEPRLFSFNNPFGACPTCQGFGRSIGIDEDMVVPDKTLTIRRGAIHPFRGDTFNAHLRALMREAIHHNVSLDAPYHTLSDREREFVWKGASEYIGVDGFFRMLEEKSYKTHYRVMLARYRGYTTCHSCKGSRLRTAARQVFVHGVNLPSIVSMTLTEASHYFDRLTLTAYELSIAEQILLEIQRRLRMLCEIGLGYLTLDRLSHTLSGGESQRINLATSLGSALVGTLYVLDEPSIGLHPRDTDRLLSVLQRLTGMGNSVVVVEHDVDVMRAANHIIDIGPAAGDRGGQVVYAGTLQKMLDEATTLTSDYLSGRKQVSVKNSRRSTRGKAITVKKPIHRNLKGDDVSFPLGCMTVVTGVSGSGKSSLVHDVLYANLKRIHGGYTGEVGACDRIEGIEHVHHVELVDQTQIGRSTRSTPATYTKTFDAIREVFASTQLARQLGWKAGHFSFNIAGGRCETCEGEGVVTIEMQFLPDIELECEECKGTRYRRDAQQILYFGKSIVDVLKMTVDEAIKHFASVPRIVSKLEVLQQVGLGYIQLGQPSSHLSGGEAQRIKLAAYLESDSSRPTLFILDEPTTGLHMHDVSILLKAFDRLVDAGHSLVVIEHNVHVMAHADWIIDIGPEGGTEGGNVVAAGTPERIASNMASHTGAALRSFFGNATEKPKTPVKTAKPRQKRT